MAALTSKRKRDATDIPQSRTAPGMGTHDFEQHYLNTAGEDMDHNDSNMNFAAVLAQHNADIGEHNDQQQHDATQLHNQSHQGDSNGPSASDTAAAAMAQFHTMTVPQSTEQAFMNHPDPGAAGGGATHVDSSSRRRDSSFGDFDIAGQQDNQIPSNGDTAASLGGSLQNSNAPKPQVGSDEWHKVRRDNHKEVERRRRETINEGINELAKIVPGCEKNKGSILARAVHFITQLKDNESQNIEKWTLEKLLTEQAISELSASLDKLKAETQRAWAECEQWKKAAQKAGVTIDVDEKLGTGGEGGD